ncbi:MAG: DPP IV N-terminal domain-containing protein [Rubripirellula sp.]
MKRLFTLPIVFVSFLAFHVSGAANLEAQTLDRSRWQDDASQRLKAIYERGEYRAGNTDAQWLPDSSAYKLREQDPQTNKSVMASYNVRTGDRSLVTNKQTAKHLSPDGTRALEARNRKLFARDLESGQRIQLTEDTGERDISYRDFNWSPNGKHILFVEVDRSDLRLRSVLVPSDPTYPDVEQHRFARVGEKLAALRVGIVNADGKQLRWLPIETPAEGFYLGQVEWAGNSDEVLVETLSRFRDKREFWITAIDGEPRRIYQEVNDAWAVGSHGINSGLKWIRGGEAFVVVSEKDGWRHATLHSRDGKEAYKLTTGDYDMIDRAAIDEAGGWYYFYASPENGTQRYLYRVPLDGSATLERVSPKDQPGTHAYQFSPDAKWAIHTYSTINLPPVVELVELPEHRVARVIDDHSELHAKSKASISRPTEFVKIDIGDGVVMDAAITKPRDFDESKKYPVFIYVYGEPYSQTVLDRWGAAQIDFLRVVADAGYVTVSIDNRGTPCPKGAAWRRSIYGSLGPLSTEDQAAALKELGRMQSYIDLSRVGIWGWSGGGSNTLNAMFRKPDTYHVGIAVVPKPQPWLYNAWFQEIYMRTREVNAEGYERSAPINFAEGLKGKLLIVTGSGETNTHIQIIEGLIDRLIELGKPFDYMVYPNRDHGLREGPGSVVHVRMLILRYLIENLPRGPR